MNNYERLINNSRHLLEDFDKYDLEDWVNLFILETTGSGLYMVADNKPSGGLIVLLAIFNLKNLSDKIFAQKSGGYVAIWVRGDGGKLVYVCTFRLKSSDNLKASILEKLRACGAPAGLFNIAKQVIMNMQVFYEMPG